MPARHSIATDQVRLSPGRHSSPREGACVVELASLLAGEEFSDRPVCVCPVIGAFLRAWNDRAAYTDRQRLRPYAERVIGSRASAAITRQRRDLCLEWSGADLGGGRLRRLAAVGAARLRIAGLVGIHEALRLDEGAPEYVARLLLGRRDVGSAFLLLDAMLAIGYAAGDGGSVLPPGTEEAASGNGTGPATNGNGATSAADRNAEAREANGNGRATAPVAPEIHGAVPAANGKGASSPATRTSTPRSA